MYRDMFRDRLPMHMPGHKRNAEKFPFLRDLDYRCDLTETDISDDFNHPQTVFREAEELASAIWKSSWSLLSVNGSTACIMAAVTACEKTRRRGRILIARNCHRSVYNACELNGEEIFYVLPSVTSDGLQGSISPQSVAEAADLAGELSCVVITSPTYDGIISDIQGIAEVCRERDIPLIVDEAHGAHLSLFGTFPEGAVACGADIVIHSLHKTLPFLTQTAAVHGSGRYISYGTMRKYMSMFQSTSPSFILSGSVTAGLGYLASDEAEKTFREWHDIVSSARKEISEKYGLLPSEDGMKDIFAYDISKILISFAPQNISADDVASVLSSRYAVDTEAHNSLYLTAMTGIGDDRRSLDRFISALSRAVPECEAKGDIPSGCQSYIQPPDPAMSPAEAASHGSERVGIYDSFGMISADYVYAYPPGIPVLVPGDRIGKDAVTALMRMVFEGRDVRGVKDGTISVVCM